MPLGTYHFSQADFSGSIHIPGGGKIHEIHANHQKQGGSRAYDDVKLFFRSHPEIGRKIVGPEIYLSQWEKIYSFWSVSGFANIFLGDC